MDRTLAGPLAVAEAIAARDHNDLFRTSCFFQDPERYAAFCAQYAVMRTVDDRVDALPSRGDLSPATLAEERAVVAAWRDAVAAIYRGDVPEDNGLMQALAAALDRFPVPACLWSNFFAAMLRDVDRARFATYRDFIDYAEGAAAAPTTIYLYMLTARQVADTTVGLRYRPPAGFDLIHCGRALGLFAYLAHILRDLPDDVATGRDGLVYFSLEDMRRHRLTEAMLREDRLAGRSRDRLRDLVAEIAQRSRIALADGRRHLHALNGNVSADCAFILRLIVTLYERLLDKIEASNFDPMAGRHRLTAAEKEAIVAELLGAGP